VDEDSLITAVREPFTAVHMDIPVDQVVRRGRAVRARRWIPGLAGALAVAAGAAVAVAGMAPSGHQAPRQPGAQLAAFSVVTGPGGATTLTLYPGQVINPDAVRQALAEHGIPALVTAGKFCYMATTSWRAALARWW
jgi:hypothetical protein